MILVCVCVRVYAARAPPRRDGSLCVHAAKACRLAAISLDHVLSAARHERHM